MIEDANDKTPDFEQQLLLIDKVCTFTLLLLCILLLIIILFDCGFFSI
jgi:hypothetical protein